MIERVPRDLTAAAVLGGTPSAAHTEALLRAIEFKGATLDEPLDAMVIGIPPTTPFLPRGAARTRSRPPTSGSGSRCGSGGTRSR